MILLKTIRGKDILYLSRNASFCLLAWPNKLVYLRFVNFCLFIPPITFWYSTLELFKFWPTTVDIVYVWIWICVYWKGGLFRDRKSQILPREFSHLGEATAFPPLL